MPKTLSHTAEKPDLAGLIKAANGTCVVVIGDLMLDHFIYGSVERISPEAPVPVLKKNREVFLPGGAGNVVANLNGLGVTARLVAMIGHDESGEKISELLRDGGANLDGLVYADDRGTITKTRYIAQGQHVLRVDDETVKPVVEGLEQKIIAAIDRALTGAQAVILSDYGKGVLTPVIIRHAISAAQKNKIPVLVDPKGQDYSLYKGADIVTPNRKELREATAMAVDSDSEIEAAAASLIKHSGIGCVIATRSEKGLSVIGDGTTLHMPTDALEVYDVAGAGDTVIATCAAMLAAGAPIKNAATLANIAAGVVVAKAGTAAISTEELTASLKYRNDDGSARRAQVQSAPVIPLNQAMDQVQQWKAQGLKVGFTNGCFDILHAGHVHYLTMARSRCDRLVVGLNVDSSIRRLKGPDRPVNDQESRAQVLAALGCVDAVIFFGEDPAEDDKPVALIRALHPDIMIKGQDYTLDRVIGADYVMSYGGEVWLAPMVEGKSTTATIEKMSKQG